MQTIQFLLFVSKTFVSIDNATLLQMKQGKVISILYNIIQCLYEERALLRRECKSAASM